MCHVNLHFSSLHCTDQTQCFFVSSLWTCYCHIMWNDFFNDSEQTTSRRLADRKIARFEKNITKRGSVPETVKKANDYPVGPILLGFFVFVVVGSSLFQIIKTASNAGLF
ncbi:uncharacterized protein [Zea mays]|uniref:Stress-associated endoplasmic reticulum protein 2 n=1 Tax=Zea mays TaxID=4577 RepID=C0HG75_MAIZE|nr:uncharacterized protein LOC100381468 isoform X1 [Zea mays]ACN26028.1 unknown [Zea mays]|eukprot:XP_023156310.1 uncharacterized LOC100381468 isoform X1 [Zea mays]